MTKLYGVSTENSLRSPKITVHEIKKVKNNRKN